MSVLNVGLLLLEIETALPDRHYEIVAVDDGSTDGTDLQLERIIATLTPMASLIDRTATRLNDFARLQSVRGRWRRLR